MLDQMDKRFMQVDKRFEELRLDMNNRFEQVDKRFDDVNKKFSQLHGLWALDLQFLRLSWEYLIFIRTLKRVRIFHLLLIEKVR
jgi:hypothetical protein